MSRERSADVVIVGAGIVGLAHALAARRLGKSVLVVDRERQTIGASIRNFGFVTVTGQPAGDTWRRARRSRDVWAEVAGPAGIAVVHRGLTVTARRPEAMAVLEAFARTDMGAECRVLSRAETLATLPMARRDSVVGGLASPFELRVESRHAIGHLTRWLETAHAVRFVRPLAVHGVEPGRLHTTEGPILGEWIILAPGDDLATLLPDRYRAYGISRCLLHMMKLADPGWRLPTAVQSDLSLVRYGGYAALPESAALKSVIEREQPTALPHGVHLIVVQGEEGGLIVGDSHRYADSPDPFAPTAVDSIILDDFARTFDGPPPAVEERWVGTYASSPRQDAIIDAPLDGVRLVVVTSGTGASTAFALAEECLATL